MYFTTANPHSTFSNSHFRALKLSNTVLRTLSVLSSYFFVLCVGPFSLFVILDIHCTRTLFCCISSTLALNSGSFDIVLLTLTRVDSSQIRGQLHFEFACCLLLVLLSKCSCIHNENICLLPSFGFFKVRRYLHSCH